MCVFLRTTRCSRCCHHFHFTDEKTGAPRWLCSQVAEPVWSLYARCRGEGQHGHVFTVGPWQSRATALPSPQPSSLTERDLRVLRACGRGPVLSAWVRVLIRGWSGGPVGPWAGPGGLSAAPGSGTETLCRQSSRAWASPPRAPRTPTFLTGLGRPVAMVTRNSPQGSGEFCLKRSH